MEVVGGEITVRKDYQGNTIFAQPCGRIPNSELKFIGALLAEKLQLDKGFREFIRREEIKSIKRAL